MNRKAFISFFFVALLAAGGCKKPPATTVEKKEAAPAKFDACGLITREEIESIQGSPVKDTKGTTRSDPAFRVSQCVYVVEEFVKSVSLMVTQGNPEGQGKRTAKDFWQETYGRYNKAEGTAEQGKQGEESEEKNKRPPKKIDGLGDEAYWSSGITTALHVLKGDTIIYLSIGGADNDETKLNKSRALVEKVLARL